MFGFFTYPHRVTSELFALGWSAESLPEISNAWIQMIHGLRKNGIKAPQAAQWIDRALLGDIEYLTLIHENSGVFGMLFFGTPKMWKEKGPVIFRKFQ